MSNPNECPVCKNVDMVVVLQTFDDKMVLMPEPKYSVAQCPICTISPKPVNRDQPMFGVVAAGWLPVLRKIAMEPRRYYDSNNDS